MATNSINGVGLVAFGNSAGTTGLTFGRANALAIDNTTNPPTVSVNGAAIGGGGLWQFDTSTPGTTYVELDTTAPGYSATSILLFPLTAPGTSGPPYLLFDPSNGGAFRAGVPTAGARGAGSVAFGNGNTASGAQSFAAGSGCTASGAQSFAAGSACVASGAQSFVFGTSSSATSAHSLCVGQFNVANGSQGNILLGFGNQSSGSYTCGIGTSNSSTSSLPTFMAGNSNAVDCPYSAALGQSNMITGNCSSCLCVGSSNNISDDPSSSSNEGIVCMGQGCRARGNGSFCMGASAQDYTDSTYFPYQVSPHSFVWSDGSALTYPTDVGAVTPPDAGPGQVVMRAKGGFKFYTNETAMESGPTGVSLEPSGTFWTSPCDRNVKENFVELDSTDILARVKRLPLYAYNYKGTDPGLVCRGPVAQDWHELFPSPAKNPLRIDTGDLDGITLAAVKGLAEENARQNLRIDAMAAEIQELRAALAELR